MGLVACGSRKNSPLYHHMQIYGAIGFIASGALWAVILCALGQLPS